MWRSQQAMTIVCGMVLSIIVFTNLPITTTRASGIQVRQQTAGVSHARRASALPRFFDGNLSGVISWGDDTASRANVNLRTATHIVSGNSHHLARLQNGTIVAWGSNTKGQITIPTVLRSTNENADDIISMDAGDNHNLVISVSHNLDTGEETYRLRAWGDNSKGQVTLPSRATNVNTMPILVAAGANHSLAYINETNPTTGESKSSVISWGNSSSATVPAALNPVDTDEHSLIKIAAQGDHNAALLSDGIVIEWYTNGRPVTYNPPDGAIYEHIAVGNNFLLLVDNSGIMTGYGDNTKGQLNIPSNVSCWGRVSAGAAHVVAMDCDGNVYAWGDSSKKQTHISADMPRIFERILAIDSHGDHTLVLYEIPPSYELVQWGQNANVLPSVRTDFTAIAAGVNHTLAITNDASVIAWGDNTYGQSTVPDTISNTVAIANGTNHSLALDVNGTIWGWGRNHAGQLDIPSNLGIIDTIAAGRDFSIVHAISDTGEIDDQGMPIMHSSITMWGNSAKTLPDGLTNVTDLKCFDNHCAATVNRRVEIDGTLIDQIWIIDWYYVSDTTGEKTVVVRRPPNVDTTFDDGNFSVGGTHTLIQQYYNHVDMNVDPPESSYSLSIRGFLISGSNLGQAADLFIFDQNSDAMPNLVTLSAGDTHSIAYLSDDTIKCWPATNPGCAIPSYLVDYHLISAGKNYTSSLAFIDTSLDPTATPSATATFTATATRTNTATHTASRTHTRTHTRTNTRTATPTQTASRTRTATSTRTNTPTRTSTRTATPSFTASNTRTRTSTRTSTNTRTGTRTAPPSRTPKSP
jgi:alpha-tubulin suppressor-like RCC1 family protein